MVPLWLGYLRRRAAGKQAKIQIPNVAHTERSFFLRDILKLGVFFDRKYFTGT